MSRLDFMTQQEQELIEWLESRFKYTYFMISISKNTLEYIIPYGVLSYYPFKITYRNKIVKLRFLNQW